MSENTKLLKLLKAMCVPLKDGTQPHVLVFDSSAGKEFLTLEARRGTRHLHVPVERDALLATSEDDGLAIVAEMRKVLEEGLGK